MIDEIIKDLKRLFDNYELDLPCTDSLNILSTTILMLEELKVLREKAKEDKWYQQGRADVIDEIEKLLLDRFTCDDLRTDWTNADIRETIHFELERLKEQKNE